MTVASDSQDVGTFRDEPEGHRPGLRENGADQARSGQPPESPHLLVGRIAHDINNVLTIITNFGDFIAEDIGAARRNGCTHLGNAAADIEKILAAARRGAGLTGQLVLFSDAAN